MKATREGWSICKRDGESVVRGDFESWRRDVVIPFFLVVVYIVRRAGDGSSIRSGADRGRTWKAHETLCIVEDAVFERECRCVVNSSDGESLESWRSDWGFPKTGGHDFGLGCDFYSVRRWRRCSWKRRCGELAVSSGAVDASSGELDGRWYWGDILGRGV